MATRIPSADERWRCGSCGNLTRFDVIRLRRTLEYWHFDLGGDHEIEESTTDQETVQSVACRWCGRSDAIQVISRAETGGASA